MPKHDPPHRSEAAHGQWRSSTGATLVGITPDLIEKDGTQRLICGRGYLDAVVAAGGVPVVLHPDTALIGEYLARCDAFIFTGGDDPKMEKYGYPTHPKATPVFDRRQQFEEALIEALSSTAPDMPVLGICLGMQMMALAAGGKLDQYMPDSMPDAAHHWNAVHQIKPESQSPLDLRGEVFSRHKQAITDPGTLRVLARADDEVIEAVGDHKRAFYIGIQWHAERTQTAALGQELFTKLVAAAR